MAFGIPWQGSKNTIAEWVIDNLPPSETFVDLFAGGCAVTHAALLSNKWQFFIANDLTDAPEIFFDACNGEFDGYSTIPNREEWFAEKDNDMAMAIIGSFGNNRQDYLYGKEIEEIKVHAERMLSMPSLYERKKEYLKFIKCLKDGKGNNQLNRIQCLERLQRLQSLQSLQSLQRLQIFRLDYRCAQIPQNSTVYIDPPYRNTNCKSYGDFDFEAFDTWLKIVPFMAVISEYTAPDGCVEVASAERSCTMNDKTPKKTIEKLFVQERFVDEYYERMKQGQQESLFENESTG